MGFLDLFLYFFISSLVLEGFFFFPFGLVLVLVLGFGFGFWVLGFRVSILFPVFRFVWSGLVGRGLDWIWFVFGWSVRFFSLLSFPGFLAFFQLLTFFKT